MVEGVIPTIKTLMVTVLNSVMHCIIVRVVLHTNKTFTLCITDNIKGRLISTLFLCLLHL